MVIQAYDKLFSTFEVTWKLDYWFGTCGCNITSIYNVSCNNWIYSHRYVSNEICRDFVMSEVTTCTLMVGMVLSMSQDFYMGTLSAFLFSNYLVWWLLYMCNMVTGSVVIIKYVTVCDSELSVGCCRVLSWYLHVSPRAPVALISSPNPHDMDSSAKKPSSH